MQQHDIHLAAAALSDATRKTFEANGFSEDFFHQCRNCAPTLYHATFRGDPSRIEQGLWDACRATLVADPEFDGILELETLVSEYQDAVAIEDSGTAIPPLPIHACPPHLRKACDVHVGVRLDSDGLETSRWLEQLNIASFQKTRPDGEWRIFTVTMDELSAGMEFYEWAISIVPRGTATTFKAKLEKIERALRHPEGAITLPLTYESQFHAWLDSLGERKWGFAKSL